MKYKYLAISLLFFLENSKTFSATPINVQKIAIDNVQQDFKITSDLKTVKSLINSLKPVETHKGINIGPQRIPNQTTHTRMQQYYQGIPVLGGYLIKHQLDAKKKSFMNGILYKNLLQDLGRVKIVSDQGAEKALIQVKNSYSNYEISEAVVKPLIFIDNDNIAHWAYKVSMLVTYPNKIPERPTEIIDAKTFVPLIKWNGIKTSFKPAYGVGFGGNMRVGKHEYGKDLDFLNISRDTVSSICLMENKSVKVVDMVHRYSGANNAMRFSCEAKLNNDTAFWTGYYADGYDYENGAYSPANDALYAGEVIKKMYKGWFNIDVLKAEDGSPSQLIMRVHFGQGFANAFWDGKQMTFGDGDEEVYPLVSIPVAAHEISHGFTEAYSNLEYYGQSGGINESFSDIAAQAAEYYALGANSWQIGNDVMKEGAIRYLDKPELDGRSISNAKDYNDEIDVHNSSGVYNHLFYLLATKKDWDVKKAFAVMVKANMDYWRPTSNFSEAGCGLIQAAHDLYYPINEVKDALLMVGIETPECDVIIE